MGAKPTKPLKSYDIPDDIKANYAEEDEPGRSWTAKKTKENERRNRRFNEQGRGVHHLGFLHRGILRHCDVGSA